MRKRRPDLAAEAPYGDVLRAGHEASWRGHLFERRQLFAIEVEHE
jgi:hypothetical protein